MQKHVTPFFRVCASILAGSLMAACAAPLGQPIEVSRCPPATAAPADEQTNPCEATEPSGLEPFSDYAALGAPLEAAHHPLDAAIRPTSLRGAEYVGIGADNEVYLVNWATGAQTQLTYDGVMKSEAVLSENYIAWMANSVMVDNELPRADIYVFDRQSGLTRKVTDQPAPRMHLVLDGQRLAWADKRNELSGHYTAYDIYAYDLATDTEIAVAIAPGAQDLPSLSGDRLVWADNRDSPERDSNLAGCGNCVNNRFDIYLYDFETGSSRALASGEGLRTSPFIAGSRVAWVGFEADMTGQTSSPALGTGDVFLLDLDTDQTQRLTQTSELEVSPIIAGDRVLWAVRWACDVVELQADGTPVLMNTGVFVYEMNSGLVTVLTDYVEPTALFDTGSALIVEGCMAGFKAYVVPLD